MAGPFTWWANRKSKMGLRPLSKKPPHLPGKEWWTNPPTTIPQPEHIEYVAEYSRQVLLMPNSEHKNSLTAYLGAWMKAARRLLHEEMFSTDRADLHTTDGLLIACDDAIKSAILATHAAGIRLDQSVIEVHKELRRRCTKLRRERAIESSKRVSIPYWDSKVANGGKP